MRTSILIETNFFLCVYVK